MTSIPFSQSIYRMPRIIHFLSNYQPEFIESFFKYTDGEPPLMSLEYDRRIKIKTHETIIKQYKKIYKN